MLDILEVLLEMNLHRKYTADLFRLLKGQNVYRRLFLLLSSASIVIRQTNIPKSIHGSKHYLESIWPTPLLDDTPNKAPMILETLLFLLHVLHLDHHTSPSSQLFQRKEGTTVEVTLASIRPCSGTARLFHSFMMPSVE
jgi:hypothetical protein